jgi:hypothetical protein
MQHVPHPRSMLIPAHGGPCAHVITRAASHAAQGQAQLRACLFCTRTSSTRLHTGPQLSFCSKVTPTTRALLPPPLLRSQSPRFTAGSAKGTDGSCLQHPWISAWACPCTPLQAQHSTQPAATQAAPSRALAPHCKLCSAVAQHHPQRPLCYPTMHPFWPSQSLNSGTQRSSWTAWSSTPSGWVTSRSLWTPPSPTPTASSLTTCTWWVAGCGPRVAAEQLP